MNIANQLTMLRIFLVPIFMYFALLNSDKGFLYAGIIFVIASITDFLDGYLARKYNMVTNFGKLMDPLADKILVLAAMLVFLEMNKIASWMVLIVITRELGISIIRAIAASSGKVIAASYYGKLKTVSQLIGIIMILFNIPFGFYIFYISIFLTAYSGFDYIRLNMEVLKG